MSYTPGPWKFGLGCPSAGFILYGSDGFVIARREVEETTDRNEEMVANARLIAAAPELYEALERLIKSLLSNDTDCQATLQEVLRGQAILERLKEDAPK